MGGKQTKSPSTLDKKSLEKLQGLVQGEISEDEIQTWYTAFKESRHSGNRELTKDEFKEVYNGLFHGDATEFAEHVFRTFDINNDGHVDFHEFLIGVFMSGSSDVDTKITWAFKVYDIDGDGNISWKEMRNIIQAVTKMTGDSVLEELDKQLLSHSWRHNKDSPYVNKPGNEYETQDRAGEIADRIFLELDENGDGLVSLEEFRQGALKIPLVLNLLECNPDG